MVAPRHAMAAPRRRKEITISDAMLKAALSDPANADLWMLREKGLPKRKPKPTESQQKELFERLAKQPLVEEPSEDAPRPPSPEEGVKRPLNVERIAELAAPKYRVEGAVEARCDNAEDVDVPVRRPAPPPRCAVPWQPPRPADEFELGLERLRVRSEVPVVGADGGVLAKEKSVAELPAKPARPEPAPPSIEVLQRAEEVLYILVRVMRATPHGARLRVAELFAEPAEGAFPAPRFLSGLPTWAMAEAEPAVLRLVGRGGGPGDPERLQLLRDDLLNSKLTHIAAEAL